MESYTRGTWSISDHYWLWSNKYEKKKKKKKKKIWVYLKSSERRKQYHKSLVPPESYKTEKNLGGWKYSFRKEIQILSFCLA